MQNMRIWNRFSLRLKLALWSVLCVFVIVLSIRALGVYGTYSYLSQHHKENIRSHMQLAALSLQDPLRNMDYLNLRQQADIITGFSGITGVRIADHNGQVLLERGELDGTHLETPIHPQSPLGRIVVSFSRDPLTQALMTVLSLEGMALALFLLATFGGLWWLSHYYLSDLRALSSCIQEGACAMTEHYPGQERQDEVGLLASTMKARDVELAVYQQELEQYRDELEHKVEERTRELKESKLLSETILNSIPDAISLVDVNTYMLMDVNTAFEKMYGMNKKDIIGRTCFDIRKGKHASCLDEEQKCPIAGYLENRPPIHYEHVLDWGPKERRYVQVSAWPVIYEQGQRTQQMVHVERDVTEQKRIEKQRQHVEQIVRHDLKSPLNGIYGMAQLLEMELSGSEEPMEYVQYIKGSVHKLLHMINNSMDLHRMEEGTYRVQAEEVDLLDILANLHTEWQHLLTKKGLLLQTVVDDQPLASGQTCPVRGEKNKLESMLANLVVNALEASPGGEAITLSVTRDTGRARIDIHNWGHIPKEIQDRFFERYVTAGKEKGTGLGTYSARLVARAHGGDISFRSSEQEGTHVRIELPLVQEGED